MIRVVLYQNTNAKIKEAYNKWFPRVVTDETIGLEELAEHMASHNTPYSKGAILGMLTDAVGCTKELLLLGKNVKFPDLAIFSLGLKVKGGADKKEDWTVAKYIEGLRLRARATGELKTSNLDTTIKRVDAVKSSSSKNPADDSTTGDTTPGGGNTTPSGGGTTPGGGDTGTDAGTDSGTDAGTDSGTGDNGSVSI